MKRTILTLLLLLGTFAVRAQLRLTLDDALRLALSENPTIRMAEMEVERYDYVKRQTWGALLPQVSVSGQLNHNFIVQQMSKGFSLGNDPYTTVSGAVDASLPLFAPQVYRMLRLNAAQMASAVEAARASRIDLVAEVKKAFYNILLAEQSLAVLHESEATVRRTVEDTQLQYDHGLASEYDLLTAEVQLSNLRPAILQTETSIRLAKLLLKMYLSIPEEIEIEAAGELDALRGEVLAGTDGLTSDLGENSDLRQLELQEEMLRLQLRAENAGRLPTLGAFGNFTLTGNNMGTVKFDMAGGGMSSIKDGYFWQHPLYAGVRLSVPRADRPSARLCAAAARRAAALGAQRPDDGARDDVRAGEDRRPGPQGLPHLRHALPRGCRDDPGAQLRTAGADAGPAQLFTGHLRLPLGQGRVRPPHRPRRVAANP